MTRDDSVIFTGADVWLHHAEPNVLPRDVLVEGGRITAVEPGGGLAKDTPYGAKVEKLPGGLLLPAFFDGHLHLNLGGRSLRSIPLASVTDPDEVLRLVAEKAAGSTGLGYASPVTATGGDAGLGAGPCAGEDWITGIGLHEQAWPVLEDLNRAAGERPMILYTRDYHSVVLNRVAIKALAVTGQTKMPDGGWMDLDGRGEPSGVFHENAMFWIEERMPRETPEERMKTLEDAIRHVKGLGILGVSDTGDAEDWLLLQTLEREQRLPIRVEAWARCLSLDAACLEEPQGASPLLRRTRLKVFLDGTLGSRTGWMHAPYADRPHRRAGPAADLEQYGRLLKEGAGRGWSFTVHAIGDGAVSHALDTLGATPCPGGLHRIEHVQHVDMKSLRHEAWSRLIPSVQPQHRTEDLGMLRARLGPGRVGWSFPARSLWRDHRPLVLGTDWPVVPADPLRTVAAAIQPRGDGEGMPGEELTPAQAIEAATLGPALAAGFTDTGAIKKGASADLVLLDRNPGGDPGRWLETRVAAVWRAGLKVYG